MSWLKHLRAGNKLQLIFFLSIPVYLYFFLINELAILSLALPITVIAVLIFFIIPEDGIDYLFIVSLFLGKFLYQDSLRIIGITISDALFPIYLIFNAIQLPMYKTSIHKSLSTINKILFFLAIVGIISLLINLPRIETKQAIFSATFILHLIQLPIVAFFLSLKCQQNPQYLIRIINTIWYSFIFQLLIVFIQILKAGPIGSLRGEFHGTFTHHHCSIALHFLLVIPIAFLKFKSHSIITKIIAIIVLISSILISILSESRSVLVGLVISLILFILMKSKFSIKTLYIWGGASIVMFLTLLLTPLNTIISDTFNSQTGVNGMDLSTYSRLLIWRGGWESFESANILKKLFGQGMGLYYTIQYSFVLWGGTKDATGAHNNPLHVLCELGISGLLLFVSYFFLTLKILFKRRKNSIAHLFFYITIALLASGISQETFWFQSAFGSFWLFYTVVLCIVLQLTEKATQEY